MFSFEVKSPVSGLSQQHLHEYQAGEAMGYTVDCKDGRFQVNKWCLHNSDFLLTMHKGKLKIDQSWFNIGLKKPSEILSKFSDNFESFKARKNFKGKDRKTFDLREFRRAPIRIVYDSLHGISTDVVELSEAVEILAYCMMDGKVDQKSSFETCLYNDLVEQLKNNEVI